MTYSVVYHPTSIGVAPGQRGPTEEIRANFPTLEVALAAKDNPPPKPGYVAVKVIDDAGKIYRQRTAGHHVAEMGSTW